MSKVRNNAVWMVRAAAAAIVVAAAQPAAAQTFQYAYYDASPKPASTSLSIPVTAKVNTRCGFQEVINKNVDAGFIDETNWSDSVSFVPECTTRWRIAISSANGGLLTSGAASPADGYLNKAPYTVALNIKTDEGDVNRSCAAADLHSTAGSACDFKGTASMTEGLRVARSYQLTPSSITVSAPKYAGPGVLISGTYQDTLTITVSPST